MLNEVSNHIKVYGNEEELNKFKEDVALNDEFDFSFNKFIGRPEDTASWVASGMPDLYVREYENWKTKWDCWDTELNEEKDHLEYKFITDWDAPYPIYETVIENYNKLNFEIDACDPWKEWAIEIVASGGEFKKYKVHGRDFVQWTKDYCICIEFTKDVLNNNAIKYLNSYLYKEEVHPSFSDGK